MNYLIKFLQTLEPKFNHCLPYFHNCTFSEAMEYAETGKITAKDCDVFEHENLVYLFLGKGRYIAKYKNNALEFTPISFILKPNASFVIDKIFPFDTGACK